MVQRPDLAGILAAGVWGKFLRSVAASGTGSISVVVIGARTPRVVKDGPWRPTDYPQQWKWAMLGGPAGSVSAVQHRSVRGS